MPPSEPEKERQSLIAAYSSMTDEELLQLAAERQNLTETARIVLSDELDRRRILLPPLANLGSNEFEQAGMVTVRKFRDLPEALLAKGSLKSAGIDCWLLDENLVRMDWFVSNFIGGIKLQVSVEDAAVAEAILQQPIPEHFDFEGGEEYQQPRCPRCRSLDTTFQELYKPVAYPSAWLGIPLPVLRKAWKCRECAHEWEDNEAQSGPPS